MFIKNLTFNNVAELDILLESHFLPMISVVVVIVVCLYYISLFQKSSLHTNVNTKRKKVLPCLSKKIMTTLQKCIISILILI